MKFLTSVLVLGSFVASTAMVSAQGASQYAPGQQMKSYGSVIGSPGASGYAPGQQMRADGSVSGTHGASGYAPGHKSGKVYGAKGSKGKGKVK